MGKQIMKYTFKKLISKDNLGWPITLTMNQLLFNFIFLCMIRKFCSVVVSKMYFFPNASELGD